MSKRYIINTQELYITPIEENQPQTSWVGTLEKEYLLNFGERMLDFLEIVDDWCNFPDGVEIQAEMILVSDLRDEIKQFIKNFE